MIEQWIFCLFFKYIFSLVKVYFWHYKDYNRSQHVSTLFHWIPVFLPVVLLWSVNLKLSLWSPFLCAHSPLCCYGSPQPPSSVSPCRPSSCTQKSSWQFLLQHSQGAALPYDPLPVQTGNPSWKEADKICWCKDVTFAQIEDAHFLPGNLVQGSAGHCKGWYCPLSHGSENTQSCRRTWPLLEWSNHCVRSRPSSKILRCAIVQITVRKPRRRPCKNGSRLFIFICHFPFPAIPGNTSHYPFP